MKFTVAKSDLEKALAVAGIAVARSEKDISSHYLFRVTEDNEIEVLAYDMRTFALAPVPKASVDDGSPGDAFTVEANRLDRWMSGVSSAKALIIESFEGGEVALVGDRTRVRLRSLDATKFPFWDTLLASAEEVGDVAPASFSQALSCSRWFISGDDTSKPELSQVEAVDGVLWATDRRALSSVEMPRVPGLSVRIPGKDVPSLVRFLNDKATQEGTIAILEAERTPEEGGGACAVFKRADGSYFGVTRPNSSFPTLNVDREKDDEAVVRINREELNAAINVLLSAAPVNHDSLTFRYDQEKETVHLVMPCDAGGEDDYPLLDVEVTRGENWDTDFTIGFTYLKGIADTFSLDNIELGINKSGRGGFVTFRHAEEDADGMGNRYYSVVVWRK